MEFSGEKSQHVELPDPVPTTVVVESDTEPNETTKTLNENYENIATVSTSKSDLKNSNDLYKGLRLDVDWLVRRCKVRA